MEPFLTYSATVRMLEAICKMKTSQALHDKITCQFAAEVKDFSSQYGNESDISHVVNNLAGPSNIYPNYGDFRQACVFRTYGHWWSISPSAPRPFKNTFTSFISVDYVELYFPKKVYPTQVDIYETFNPGAVIRVLACDDRCAQKVRWEILWEEQPIYVDETPRILAIAVKPTDFPTNIVRLELNHRLMRYYTELDAVKLHGYEAVTVEALPGLESSVDFNSSNNASSSINGDLYHDETSDTVKSLSRLHIQDGLSAALESTDNGHFDSLPEEVIQVIIGYLDLESRCKLSMTSRFLYKNAYDPLLYTELNLQPYWHKVRDSTFEALHSHCSQLQRINLSWCGNHGQITSPVLCRFFKICGSNLTCVRLACSRVVNNSVLDILATVCEKLQELDIQGNKEVDNTGYTKLTRLSNLQNLNLYRTNIDIYSVIAIIRSSPNLKQLNLGSCACINNFDDVAVELAKNCKNLQCLDVWRARTLTEVGLIALAGSCPELEELDLGWCPGLQSQSDCFRILVAKCRNLKKIFLTANGTVGDEDLNAIAKHCVHLEQLDILGNREVSQQMARKLLQCCTKLKFFKVSFCAGISSSDVDELSIEFPHVAIKKRTRVSSTPFQDLLRLQFLPVRQ